MTDTHQKSSDKLAAIYERAWTDKAFSARLDSDPKAAIEEIVGELPQDMEFKVVRDTADTKYLHIPAAPKQGEVSDNDLVGATGGTTQFCQTQSISGLTCTVTLPPNLTTTFVP